MSNDRIGTAVLKIEIDGTQYEAALGDLNRRSQETSEGVRGIGQALNVRAFTDFAQTAVRAIGTVVSGIIELGTRGSDVADVSASFSGLSEAAGQSADVMLGQLRAGVQGTITDFELMRMSNGVLSAGLVRTSEDMGTLAAGATLLANRTGGQTAAAFQQLTSAMASGRVTQLRQLGVFVDTDAAVAAYARTLGTVPAKLTDQQRATAVAQATLAQLRQQLEAAGPASLDFADRVEVAKVMVQNFVDNLGMAIATSPVVAAGMDATAAAIQRAFGGDQQQVVGFLTGLVNRFALMIVDVAAGIVGAARLISNAWDGLKVIFNVVFAVISHSIELFLGGLASLIEMASGLPGVGDKFAGMAASVQAASDDMAHLTRGFIAQGEAAVDSAADTNLAADAVQAAITEVRAAMEAAQGAPPIPPPITPAVTQDVRDAATAVTEFVDHTAVTRVALETEAAAIALAFSNLQAQMTAANLTGINARLFEIERGRTQELASLDVQRLTMLGVYEQMAAAVNAKYDQMAASAVAAAGTARTSWSNTAFQHVADMQTAANVAQAEYARMLASGTATAQQLTVANAQSEAAQRAARAATRDFYVQSTAQALGQVLTTIGSFGRQYKALAIAGAVISGLSAIQKAWAAAPFPANLPGVAVVTASTAANIAAISRSQPGFATGTPGLDFSNFGPVTNAQLHGHEAVIPRGSGHQLAAEIAAAMPGQQDTATVLARIADGIDGLPNTMKRAFRDGLAFATG